MLLTEKEARAICEKMLSYVKADDASVGVGSDGSVPTVPYRNDSSSASAVGSTLVESMVMYDVGL